MYRSDCSHSYLFVQNILQTILTVMGLTLNEVSDADTLSRLGIDSMQLVEVSLHP